MSILERICAVVLILTFTSGPLVAAPSTSDFRRTSELYASMIKGEPDVAKLNLFFTNMPKGGDLHNHYSGTIYAETYLDWVAAKGWQINACTLRIVVTPTGGENCELMTVPQLIANDTLYRKLLTRWSDKDFSNHFHDQPPPDSNFFNTFGYFGTVSNEYMEAGLNILKQRALKENVSYIETMFTRVGSKSANYFTPGEIDAFNLALKAAQTQVDVDTVLGSVVGKLSENPDFVQSVKSYIAKVEALHQGIDNEVFMMRYQTYAVRTADPLQVFMDLYSGYLAAEQSPLIVGVNIVAPENNEVALNDYTLHMRMYNYLHGKYPLVNRALHAGELTLGMVRPKDLLFHIRQARDIAHAQRIGHGVDIPYEQNSLELLADLKKNAAIEINLTSNQFILGVAGREHPYLIYASYGVPLVISTDDSGVSRNNLTHEYMLLASRYRPTYAQIKAYVYNSIKYSFLSAVDKVAATKVLDSKFVEFERNMAGLSKHMK